MAYTYLERNAEFTEDGKHRLWLYRKWHERWPTVMWIGLNPSDADGYRDDPTIRRVVRFSVESGYGSLYMCNAFTYISTDPRKLETAENHYQTMIDLMPKVQAIVACWGAFEMVQRLGMRKRIIFAAAVAGKPMYCLGRTKDGYPRHPLYVRGKQQFEEYGYK